MHVGIFVKKFNKMFHARFTLKSPKKYPLLAGCHYKTTQPGGENFIDQKDKSYQKVHLTAIVGKAKNFLFS